MSAAARLLEMAEESSASTVAEARQEADRILARAQTEASTLLTAARRQADQITSDAHDHAARLQQSVHERQEQALRPVTEQRDELQRDIAGLRALALECRSRMRAYADEPLPGLDADPAGEATIQIGQMVPVPAGRTGPPSGHDSAPGAWTIPSARQGPDPEAEAAAMHTSNGHRVPPNETGSPAPDPASEPGGQSSAHGDGPE
jgi:vacuolar-type H+-ATPase subunit H